VFYAVGFRSEREDEGREGLEAEPSADTERGVWEVVSFFRGWEGSGNNNCFRGELWGNQVATGKEGQGSKMADKNQWAVGSGEYAWGRIRVPEGGGVR